MTTDDMIDKFEILHPSENDIIVIKVKKHISTFQVRQMVDSFNIKLGGKYKILVIGDNLDISALTEKEMNSMGWYKNEKN